MHGQARLELVQQRADAERRQVRRERPVARPRPTLPCDDRRPDTPARRSRPTLAPSWRRRSRDDSDRVLREDHRRAYAFEGATIDLGRGVHDGALERDAVVRLPLATTNRHGLIAGATGTGKTRTLQLLAEQLSAAGVSVFAADYKGDLSGLAGAGAAGGPAEARMEDLGLPFEPTGFPVEFLSLGGIGSGVPVRATVTDFGPQLLAKVLGANETQEQSLALVFRFADEQGLPLVDLADLRALLTFFDSDGARPT